MKEIQARASVIRSHPKQRPTAKVLRRRLQVRFAPYKLATLLVLFASPQDLTTQEAGSKVGSEIGANLDIFVKPLFKLSRFTVFQLDESKSRLLTLKGPIPLSS
jgi:hypothetical protein